MNVFALYIFCSYDTFSNPFRNIYFWIMFRSFWIYYCLSHRRKKKEQTKKKIKSGCWEKSVCLDDHCFVFFLLPQYTEQKIVLTTSTIFDLFFFRSRKMWNDKEERIKAICVDVDCRIGRFAFEKKWNELPFPQYYFITTWKSGNKFFYILAMTENCRHFVRYDTSREKKRTSGRPLKHSHPGKKKEAK